MLKQTETRFCVPPTIEHLQFADCPISDELAKVLHRLEIQSFDQMRFVSLELLWDMGDKTGALALELGCLIRRAARGEFRRLCQVHAVAPRPKDWWNRSPGTRNASNGGGAAEERFFIPENARKLRLSCLAMSCRLGNMLGFSGLELLGDVHGVPKKRFLDLQGFGIKYLEELSEIVRLAQAGELYPEEPTPPQVNQREARRFAIPEALRPVSPYQFQMSRRLDGVLRRAGIACFEDLDGTKFKRILAMGNCGPGTLRELLLLIERAASGGTGTP